MKQVEGAGSPLPRLGLRSIRREYRAIGQVEAEPRLFVGEKEYSALTLSERLSSSSDYLLLPDGEQISQGQARASGLAGFGRAYDGTSLEPFPLPPESMLWHDFRQVPGPWQEIYPLILTPPVRKPYAHLEWLRYWGFSGGLFGTLYEVGVPLVRWLKDYLDRVPQPRVLVVGTATVQNYMYHLANRERVWRLTTEHRYQEGCLNFISPELVVATPQLAETTWDIVCLVNAHMFLGEEHSQLVNVLQTLPRRLFVGLFAHRDWQERTEQRIRCASLLGITAGGSNHLIWHYLLRNPKEMPRPLPEPPAIPLRSEGEVQERREPDLAPYSFELRSFIRDAEHFSQVSGTPVPFRPYYNQRPNYGTLDRRQLAWYLYWRHEVRQGRYLETGLDYIRLLAQELVNGFGGQNVMERYRFLQELWLHYRQAYPSLDNWLPEWLCDYLLVNECPLDPLLPLLQAAKLSIPTRYPDMLLERFHSCGWRSVPFSLLEQLLGISLRQSQVYTSEDRKIIAETVLRTLHNIEAKWIQENGQGILARYRPPRPLTLKRLPFSNTLFGRATRLIYFGRYYPYSQQRGFLQLLLAVVKESENLLRVKRGYRGRVRTAAVSDLVPKLVEEAFLLKQPSTRVTIDNDRVKELLVESDAVRDLLLAKASKEGSETDPTDGEDKTPGAGLATMVVQHNATLMAEASELEVYIRLFDGLEDMEIRALAALLEDDGWEKLIHICQERAMMPELLVDRINQVALEVQNDILIDTTSTPPTIVEDYLSQVIGLVKHFEAQKR